MLELALKSKIPIIGVKTDDVVNWPAILQSIAKKNLHPLPTLKAAVFTDLVLYYTEGIENITPTLYRKLAGAHAQVIVINPEKSSSLIFDAGTLEVPDVFFQNYLSEFVDSPQIYDVIRVLKGLSLKAAQEITQLTMARTGSLLPYDIKQTRFMLGASNPGLEQLETNYHWYDMPKGLQEWIDINHPYFHNPKTPKDLVPRGILLSGKPGTGKTLAAKVIAYSWDLPLYRIDIAGVLNRYIGESEKRIATALMAVAKEEPCVLLVDEIDKLFGNEDEASGTTGRILSTLLWWLQEHKERVFTIFTTNKVGKIPPELIRPGRLDKVIELPLMSYQVAVDFAMKTYTAILNEKAVGFRKKAIFDATVLMNNVTPAEIISLVVELIKQNDWYEEITLDKLSLKE